MRFIRIIASSLCVSVACCNQVLAASPCENPIFAIDEGLFTDVALYSGASGVAEDIVDSHQSSVAHLGVGFGFCSGTLLPGNLFLTAAHCFDPETVDLSNAEVVFNYQLDPITGLSNNRLDRYGVSAVVEYGKTKVIVDGEKKYIGDDYAILQLKTGPEYLYPVARLSDRTVDLGEKIFAVNHGGGLPKHIIVGQMNSYDHQGDSGVVGMTGLWGIGGASGGSALDQYGYVVAETAFAACDSDDGYLAGIGVRKLKEISPAIRNIFDAYEQELAFGYFNDFENGIEWANIGRHNWVVGSGTGTPPSWETGPSNFTGKYVFFNTSSNAANTEGDEAILISHPISIGMGASLSFDYHMFGRNMGSIFVDVYRDGSWQNIWQRTGQQHFSGHQSWTKATLGLEEFQGESRIRFRAVASGGHFGHSAIDNIHFVSGSPLAVKPRSLLSRSGLCLDIPFPQFGNSQLSTRLQSWECWADNPNQKWVYNDDGEFVSNDNRCLTAGGLSNGSTVNVSKCINTDMQRWDYDADSGLIKSRANPHQCIDIPSSAMTNGQLIQMRNCLSGNNQRFGLVDLSYKRMRHVLAQNSALNIEKQASGNSIVDFGPTQSGWLSAQWTIELVGSSHRIRNKWKKNEFLHIENGVLQSSSVPDFWASAMWKVRLRPELGDNVYTIVSAWLGDRYLVLDGSEIKVVAGYDWRDEETHWILEEI